MIDVTAAVLIENGKVLIARRRPGASQAGLWELPGGKVRAGESPAQCLKREIREELGIEIVVEEFFGESVYDDPRNDQAPFSALYPLPEAQARYRLEVGVICDHNGAGFERVGSDPYIVDRQGSPGFF